MRMAVVQTGHRRPHLPRGTGAGAELVGLLGRMGG